jgi:hypothetical protein
VRMLPSFQAYWKQLAELGHTQLRYVNFWVARHPGVGPWTLCTKAFITMPS